MRRHMSREDVTPETGIPMQRFTRNSTRYQRLASEGSSGAADNERTSDYKDDDYDYEVGDDFPRDFEDANKDDGHVSSTLLGKGRSLALGVPGSEKRFWFQRSKTVYDPGAIATQPSVFDDPETLEDYKPGDDWENIHRFDPDERWTWGEEHVLIRKIDSRIMVFAAVMFMALELDRSNISQALTDNFLEDLGMTTNDYNLGNTAFKLAFLCAELPSQLVAKWVGPDIWIPTQMVIILYLSYFYKHHELSLRLGFFWTASAMADVMGGFLAFGLLHLRGVDGQAGWRWLFLIEGLITLVVGLLAYGLMPSSPTSSSGWLRGEKGWFSEREEKIMVNRIIREDPSKSSMHNREPLTPKLLWQSMKDYDLWPIYILGLTFQTPMSTPSNYLTLSLRGLGFDTFKTNLLVIPSKVLHVITMLGLTYAGEIFGELTFTALIGQIWALPFLIFINIVDINGINKWAAWGIMTALLCYPSAHPIQVGWNSRNSNTVRSRTVSAALYNMCVQTSGIIAANIYQKDDAPLYHRGNHILLAILILNIFLYLGTKVYYVKRNAYKDRTWGKMSEDERMEYLATTIDEGSKRLDFRFAH
ncbi:probable permease of the major facilitator superfamily [Phialocephala subalpina]|uniref:Probable permease of the major facilitator superfamily n=1 Tax=Phialocephala subalpina TaxID=576137 RepID=A0A1L7WIU7_9HELO|nr:probable permease of the major facilitator superfamily [Phialocephala subalpina]